MKRNQCVPRNRPPGAQITNHMQNNFYKHITSIYRIIMCRDAIVWLFSSAARTEYIPVRRNITQFSTAAASLAHTARRHYYIFRPAGASTSTC